MPGSPDLRRLRSLATGKGRRGSGLFLAEGERAVGQIIRSRPGAVVEVLYSGDAAPAVIGIPTRRLTEKQLKSLSSAITPPGIIAVVRLPADTCESELPENPGRRVLLLEDVQDPGNLGTLLRTAAAFGYDGALLTGKCADPYSPKAVQSSAGSVLSLWLRRTGRYLELASRLRQAGFVLAAADLAGSEALPTEPPDKMVLALGNEASGLSAKLIEMADTRWRIPVMENKAESLNVAVCGGILMHLMPGEITG